MNILITGANGQLGTEMKVQSSEHPQHVYYFTDVAELDICNKFAVDTFIKDNNIQIIVNCAAYTAVDKAEDDKTKCAEVNYRAPCHLAEAAHKNSASLIQISTDYVFDGTSCVPYKEDDDTNPLSIYGYTKEIMEEDIMALCENTVVIRTSWLYSEYGNNFVKTVLKLGKERESLTVVSDQVGTPTYAGDLADAIYAIIDNGIIPGIYHYSNEGVCSWYDFTKAIHRFAGITTCDVQPVPSSSYPTKAHRPSYSVLDKTKIKETYSLKIPYWMDSLDKCVRKLENIIR